MMNKRRAIATAWLAMSMCSPCVVAAPAGWAAVDQALLDTMRGGFTTASGLDVSLGVERIVSINGVVMSRTNVVVADMARLDPEQARQTGATLSAIKLIQNGNENMVHAALPHSGLGGTIIQNTLDGQQIHSHTVINASANSIGLLNTLNFQGSLGDAIARSAGPR